LYDAIVIGGGFCGVTAARECAKSGLRTVVLEARDRLGGRTYTTQWNGHLTELGGTWVHWTQPYVWAEIERYGLPLVHDSVGGGGQAVLRRSDGDLAPVDFGRYLGPIFGAAQQYMGASREIFPNPHRPFESGMAEKFDTITAADPLANIPDPFVRDFFDAFISTSVGNRAREGAWVEMVRGFALAGHNYVDHVAALALYRLRNGTKALIEAMIADARPEVRLSTAVTSVHADAARVAVTTASGESLEAKALIATVPLNVLRDVKWEPALDERKLEASAQRHAGASTKLHVLVEGEHRVAGLAPSDSALNSLSTHRIEDGKTHLIGFGPGADLLDVTDPDDVKRAVRELLPGTRMLDFASHDWNADPHARGTWCTLRPGQYSRHLAALQRPQGRVFFASADWANGWRGNIDGAVEQGLSSARAVRALLA
jgi:pseudooxynicotine dehydrogenase